jgi:hypothetical protein
VTAVLLVAGVFGIGSVVLAMIGAPAQIVVVP